MAAALALGADGVWIGTRFIATPEARAVAGYKDALVRTKEDGTTISRAFSGKTMRVVRNEYTTFFDDHPDELSPFPAQLGRSMKDGAFHLGGGEETAGIDPGRECYPTGQGVGAIQTLMPAASLVAQIVDQAEQVLNGLGRMGETDPGAGRDAGGSGGGRPGGRPRRPGSAAQSCTSTDRSPARSPAMIRR